MQPFDKMSAPASSSKRSHGPAAHSADRLSSLPDPLLHLVMSFLPMREVVRTSLLSPRWRDLWASVPFIHLDFKEFVDATADSFVIGVDDHDWLKLDENRLQKFGDHLLLLRDGAVPLDEARIFIGGADLSDKYDLWIHHAIKHKARLLHVYAHRFLRVEFNDRSMIRSQHLKIIRLQEVTLTDTSLRPLNFYFPVLEHLELDCCIVNCVKNKISSRSLQTIRITCCEVFGDLEICAPNLNHLYILDPVFGGHAIVTRDLYSLVTASISLSALELYHGILDGLSRVTTLELHAPLLEKPTRERCLETCPVFSNLISLVLGEWCMASNFSPKLKYLTFKLRMDQLRPCKAAERDRSPRGDSSLGGYPSIERTMIYCGKDDPRVSALVKVLLPIVIPGGEISIKGH